MDAELDDLIRRETLERSLRTTERLTELSEQLARSLAEAAAAFERLATVPAEAEMRRDAFRRAECPGRFH